jgi:tripartite-type tricarboxylate transporter receptor subunit TctC
VKRQFLKAIVAGTLLMGLSTLANAQTYPDKPIRLVIPFSAGGGTDTFGRILAGKLQERLGQSVVAENKPGAGGNIGADMVAKSTADGYTLLLAQDSLTIAPWLYQSLNFDVMKDFAPIGVGVFMPMVLIVANDLPVNTVGDLIAYAKKHPDRLSYGSPGVGTAHHLNFESFLNQTDSKMIHVPYKGASGMVADLASGNVHVAFSALSSVLSLIESGRVRAIAVADDKRAPQLKDVPTITETIPGYTANVWFGLMAPAKTPREITEKLSEEMRAIVNTADVRERLTEMGYRVQPTTPDEMTQILNSEYEKWGALIKAVNIKPD